MAKWLVFDLDDTIVDTFEILIRPLEAKAAALLHEHNLLTVSPEAFSEQLLELRRRNPERLYAMLGELAGEEGPAAIELHKGVFSDFSIESLIVAVEIRSMIQALRSRFTLVLMTEGRRSVQQAKIDHLDLAEVFHDILIVDPEDGETKLDVLRNYAEERRAAPDDIIVIGNRLDREIAAGRILGAKTIWVRSGEGSELECPADESAPDAVVDDVLDILPAIDAIAKSGRQPHRDRRD